MVGLNPCFSGGWSRRLIRQRVSDEGILSLNPCFSGGWSRRGILTPQGDLADAVLILVLVEDGLGGCQLDWQGYLPPS